MAIPPIQAASQALELAPLARAASSAISTAFSSLLQGAVEKTTESAENKAQAVQTPPNSDDRLNVSAIRRRNDLLIQEFQTQIRNLLGENGLDLSSGVHLQLDELGRIRVNPQHADAHQIESLLATRPELGDLLQNIAANSQLLNAAEQAGAFQKLYAMDPAAAVANAPHLFSNPGDQIFDLYLDSRRFEVSFRRPLAGV